MMDSLKAVAIWKRVRIVFMMSLLVYESIALIVRMCTTIWRVMWVFLYVRVNFVIVVTLVLLLKHVVVLVLLANFLALGSFVFVGRLGSH